MKPPWFVIVTVGAPSRLKVNRKASPASDLPKGFFSMRVAASARHGGSKGGEGQGAARTVRSVRRGEVIAAPPAGESSRGRGLRAGSAPGSAPGSCPAAAHRRTVRPSS